MARLKRPLDREAVRQADEKVYVAHAGDPRPNALYDAHGNRRPLNATDPAQAQLREEWVAAYRDGMADSAEPLDSGSSEQRAVADPVEPCPNSHWFSVAVVPRPDAAPRPDYWAAQASGYAGESFAAQLPNGPKSGELDSSGGVRLTGIPAGGCQLKMDKFFKPVAEYLEREVKFDPTSSAG